MPRFPPPKGDSPSGAFDGVPSGLGLRQVTPDRNMGMAPAPGDVDAVMTVVDAAGAAVGAQLDRLSRSRAPDLL